MTKLPPRAFHAIGNASAGLGMIGGEPHYAIIRTENPDGSIRILDITTDEWFTALQLRVTFGLFDPLWHSDN